MSTTALVSTKPITFPKLPCVIASDGPETGGISGTLEKFDKPKLWVCEERPKMIDPETGEWVYVDVYQKDKPWICYTA